MKKLSGYKFVVMMIVLIAGFCIRLHSQTTRSWYYDVSNDGIYYNGKVAVGSPWANWNRWFSVCGSIGIRKALSNGSESEVGYILPIQDGVDNKLEIASTANHNLFLTSGSSLFLGSFGRHAGVELAGDLFKVKTLNAFGITTTGAVDIGGEFTARRPVNLLQTVTIDGFTSTRNVGINGTLSVSSSSTFNALRGSGMRMVVTNSDGQLSSQPLPNMSSLTAPISAISNSDHAYLSLETKQSGRSSGLKFMAKDRKSWLISNTNVGTNSSTGTLSFQIDDGGLKTVMELRKRNGKLYAWAPLFCVSTTSDACPDYVFQEDYKLKSIEELEEYVKKEKHLPNVPSAKEIGENGELNVEKMLYATLEKVEESSLYIIQLNKELKAKDKKIEELIEKIKKIAALEEEMKAVRSLLMSIK